MLPVLETLVLAQGFPLAYQTRPALHGVSQQHAGAFDESVRQTTVRLFAPSRSPHSRGNWPIARGVDWSEENPTHCTMFRIVTHMATLTDPLVSPNS